VAHRALFGDGFLSLSQFLGVHQIVVVDGFHFFVEFEDERHGSRYVVSEDLLVVHAGQLLNDGADGVTVSDDNGVLAVHDLGADGIIPVRHDTVKSGSQRLRARKGRWGQKFVAIIVHRVSLVAHLKSWRWDVVAASPLEDLLFSVLLSSLDFVKSLEATVMTLVKSPGFVMGDVQLSHLNGDVVIGLNSALEDRGVGDIEFKALLFQGLSGSNGFGDTIGGEIDVVPTSESVFEVPDGLTVSEEDNSMGSFLTSFLHDLN